MNTTREQNLKEFNNTAGRLDGSLKWINQVELPWNHPSPSPTDLKIKKDKCRNLLIWTSTISNIRIQKLFIIGNQLFFISQTKKLAKDECVITFLDNIIFFWVSSMKNIILNI
jgi:hypothetical protein